MSLAASRRGAAYAPEAPYMSSRKWVWFLGCLTPILALAGACAEGGAPGGGSWTGVCIDVDGDGYGFQCAGGSDCDDNDRTVHTSCGACGSPSEGCACEPGTAAVDCTLPYSVTASGSLLCRNGTRYCRDGKWTACEGLASFEVAGALASSAKWQGLLDTDASVACDPCMPDCYTVRDPLDIIGDDGGLPPDASVAYTSNGGITLTGEATGGSTTPPSPDDLTPIPPCNPTLDSDCDGIPNSLDPYPETVPFESEHATIFMDIAPGKSATNTFDLRFYLKTADIYFLLDMTGSMNEERDKLIASLKSGDFLDDPSTPANESALQECADVNFDGAPDDGLKTRGVTGNIACIIRSAGFGAGWYREVPFSATDSTGIRYSYPNFEPYENRLDIVTDATAVAKVGAALDLFVTRGNQNWAEAGGVALSAVATGGPIYMGWDRPGIPRKTCAEGRFGYPCFRNDAMPIVVLITDAPLMNGPNTATNFLGTDSNSNKLQPVNYDGKGLNYRSSTPDGAYHPVSGNESIASAYDVGTIDSTFKTFTGDTRGMTADLYTGTLPGTCPGSAWPTSGGAAATSSSQRGYPDAVFKFRVTDSTKKLTISTRGSHFKPTLAIFPVSAPTAVSSGTNATPATAKNLGTLSLPIGVAVAGDTTSSSFNVGDLTATMLTECMRDEDLNETAPDAWYTFSVPADVNNVRFAIEGDGYSPILGLWEGNPSVTTVSLASRSNDRIWQTASTLSSGTAATPGNLDGKSYFFSNGSTDKSGIAGDYGEEHFQTVDDSCASARGTTDDGVIDFSLAARATVRIETTSSVSTIDGPGWNHMIGLFRRPEASGTALAASNAVACNQQGLSTRSFIERALDPGTYSVVVRGRTRAYFTHDQGTYGLLIADAAVRPVGCHSQYTTPSFTANLKAGKTYYLGMRGRKTGRGKFKIYIGTVATAQCAYDNTTYQGESDDASYSLGASEIADVSFAPGEYYAIVKGRGDIVTAASGDSGRGWYQISFGDKSLATTDSAFGSMPVWGTASSGIRKQLLDTGIRVITVTSTKSCSGCSGGAANANTALRDQGDTISLTTGAISTAGTALRFDIYNDGTGMGFAIVDAIRRLSKNVSMNVSARFVPLPDTPSKPFIFKSRAIDQPGDLCTGTLDADGDGTVDTHTSCTPGATPRFQITFTNPAAPNNVPPNPAAGSNGGYNMRIELVGDGRYIVDQTPVFIIPQDVVPDPPAFIYVPTGTYAQDFAGSCTGTDRPNWQTLSWADTLPQGTSFTWQVCAGETQAELASCQAAENWTVVATVSPGEVCTDGGTPCSRGFCSAGVCHIVSSPGEICEADVDCGSGGRCESEACGWMERKISLAPALKKGLNGKRMLRVQVKMNANDSLTAAPSIQDFSLQYTCSPGV